MSEVVLIIGMQGSGKSTIVNEYTGKGFARLNRDQTGKSMDSLLPEMGKMLAKKRNVVLDNTFCTVASRKPFVDMAKAAGATVRAVAMGTSFEDCQYNVCQRLIEIFGHAPTEAEIKASKNPNVFPPAVIYKYRKEYQMASGAEGFDSITSARFVRQYPKEFTAKAIFLDKDGTLTETISGEKYPCTPDDVRVLPGRTKKLKDLKQQGYMLLGVSNQSGVAKGTVTLDNLQAIFRRTNQLLGVDIEWAYCPHRIPPVSCYCRKPAPMMLVSFIQKYKLHNPSCIFVGDATTDKTCAARAGMQYESADTFFG